MKHFEEVLAQYEPMISATIRNLNIYRDYPQFRQAGRIALWQAWQRYDESKGHFAPYASMSIRGAMLELLKQENRFSDRFVQTEDDLLIGMVEEEGGEAACCEGWSEFMQDALDHLTDKEKEMIQWLYVERLSYAACAERANISVPGIKKRRERLLLKLRTALSQTKDTKGG